MENFQILTPESELEYLKEIYGDDFPEKIFGLLAETFNVLQNRAQMLLSLVTITLTITGFSGPKIAASSLFARVSIALGLSFVFLSALIMMSGPLQCNWCTQSRAGSIDQSLVQLIRERNFRTSRYDLSSIVLVIGLLGYVLSVVTYLITG